jgi:predicted small integral membrane protein
MHTLFYLSIIAWETATTVLCSWGAAKLGRALHGTAVAFESAK